MKQTFLSLTLGILFLSACSLVPEMQNDIKGYKKPYVEPTSGERVRVRFTSDGLVRAIPNRDCLDWDVPEGGMVLDRTTVSFNDHSNQNKSLGMPDRAGSEKNGKKITELYAKANEPLVVDYQHLHCGLTAYFVPEAKADYEVDAFEIWTDIIGRYATCYFKLYRLEGAAPEIRRIPIPATRTLTCQRMGR